MDSVDTAPARTGFWAILLLSVFAWAPATYPGYWQALDGFVPVFNAAHPTPIAGIATTPDLWRGTGSAAFILTQPFLLLGLSPVAAVRAVFIIGLLLGSLGIYAWLQPRWGDRAAGLAGVIYLFMPTVLSTIYVRGSLSDALVLALLPSALAGIAAYAATLSPAGAGITVISLLWLWRSQAGLAVFVTLLLLLYALVVERNRLAVLVVGVAGLAGFASLLPLWSIRGTAPVDFGDHFVYLFQLFGQGWQVAPSIPGWQDQYPFQLGFAAVGFSVVALWLWLRNPRDPRRALLGIGRSLAFALGGTIILVLLASPVSAPLWQLSGAGRLLTYPWQLLLLTAPLLALSAGSLPLLQPVLARMPYWALLVAVVLLAGFPTLTTDFTQVTPGAERPYAVIGADNDLVLLSANLVEARTEAGEAELQVTWQVLKQPPFDYNVFFQAVQEDQDGRTVVAQLDAQPLGGVQPPTTWQPGRIFQETYRLSLADLPAGSGPLTYFFGYYDWRDGTRLPVDGGIDDKLVFYGQ